MDSDAKTCGKCRHGNFYDGCKKCEDEYEKLRAENERLKRGEFICQRCGLRKDGEQRTELEF
jgi:hypothetical protein